ncbi:MAG: gliding motility-associated C-terminal domain-containing protein [Saprospiraceae bacterium]|nr:gliding motility-associated C-terminal domain-containing protein [Candidatus Vicinibacter affinis]
MKTNIYILMCIILTGIENSNAQNLILKQIDPLNFSVCGEGDFDLILENNTGQDLSSIQIKGLLPTGLEYKAGSLSGALEGNIITSNEPEFIVISLLKGAIITLNFTIQSNCQIYNDVNNGMLFQNKWIMHYLNTKDSILTSPPYKIETGFLVIENQSSTIKEVGSSFKRLLKIRNTRLGNLSEFIFEDKHDPLDITSKNGDILMYNDTLLRMRLGPKDFKNIGDGDEFFENGEIITIDEEIIHRSCLKEFIQSYFRADWGCKGQSCQVYEEAAGIDFVIPAREASLSFNPMPQFPECICSKDGALQMLTIYNTGGAVAENITITLKASNAISGPYTFGFLYDSFSITGSALIDSIEYKDLLNLMGCKMDSAFHEVKIKISNLNPGESFKLNFRLGSCLTSSPSIPTNFPWLYSYKYNSVCIPGSDRMLLNKPVDNFSSAASITANLVMTPEDAILIDNKIYSLESKIKLNPVPTNRNLFVSIQIPCPLLLIDSTFQLNNKSPISKKIDNNNFTSVVLEFTPPFTSEMVLKFNVKLDCNSSCLKKELNAVNTQFNTSCPNKRTLKPDLVAKICLEAHLTCVNKIDECGPSSFAEKVVEFPCASATFEQDTISAFVDFDSKLYRLNVGEGDPDDDRFKLDNLTDLRKAELKRFITGDTIVYEFKARLKVDNENLKHDSLCFYIFSDLSYSDINSNIRIIKNNGMNSYEFNFPIYKEYKSKELLPSCTKPQLVENGFGNGIYIPITPESANLYGAGLPIDFKFENGDSIYLKTTGVISSYTGQQIAKVIVLTKSSLISKSAIPKNPFSCHEIQDTIKLTSMGLEITQEGIKKFICTDKIILPQMEIKVLSNLDNFFPYEYRSLFKMDSFTFQALNGIIIDSFTIELYYNISGQKTLYRTIILPAILRNNRWYAPQTGLDSIRFDEAYTLLIIPIGRIVDCKKLNATNTQSISTYNYSGDKNAQFYIDPSTSIFYTKNIFSKLTTIEILNGNKYINQPVKTIFAAGKSVGWNFELSNVPFPGSFKFKVTSRKKTISNLILNSTPPLNITKPDSNLFLVKGIEPNSTYRIFFQTEINGCNTDTVDIISTWSCDGEEQSPGDCTTDSFSVIIKPENPELELDLIQEDRILDLCDTLPEINLEIYNADRGIAKDVFLEVKLPDGISFIDQEIKFSYPKGSSFRMSPPPQKVNSNTFRWDIEDLDSNLKLFGLKGILSAPENSIIFKFLATTNCQSTVNSFIEFRTNGKNLCNQLQNTVAKNSRQIRINDINSNTDTQIDLLINDENKCEDSVIIKVSIRSNQTTHSEDSIKIVLPIPLNFLDNSVINISNHNQKNPIIIQSARQTFLHFDLEDNLSAGKLVEFEFKVSGLNSFNCKELEIQANSFSRKLSKCKNNDTLCPVFFETGFKKININRKLPGIDLLDFNIISNQNSPQSEVKIQFKLTDLTELISEEICFGLFEDKNSNQQLDSLDNLVSTIILNKNEFNVDGIYSKSILINDNLLDYCSYLLVVLPKNCVCLKDTLSYNFQKERIFEFKDSLCFGARLILGKDSIPGKRYIWTGNKLSCDSCSSNIFFAQDVDSISRFDFELLEYSLDSCNKKYTYQIIVFPNLSGQKFIEQVCLNDTVSLNAGSKENYTWKGEDVLQPGLNTQTVVVDKFKTLLLDYYDNFNCFLTDTFCLIPYPDTNSIAISNDTTILAGTKVTLCAQGGYSYKWSPDDGSICTTCPCITVNPSRDTRYFVSIADTFGCIKNLNVLVSVISPSCDSSTIFFPNAFSPNGDGRNDILYVRSSQIDKLLLRIYNRWGELVFQSSNPNIGWDGTFNGKYLPPDVFGYYLEAYCIGGDKYVKKGNISLLK